MKKKSIVKNTDNVIIVADEFRLMLLKEFKAIYGRDYKNTLRLVGPVEKHNTDYLELALAFNGLELIKEVN